MITQTSWTKILKFSLPMTFIGILDLGLILIDFFWIYILIGNTNAMASVRVSSSIVIILESVIVAVISALMVYISQHSGAGNLKQARKGIRTAFSFSIYGGILMSIIGFLCIPLLIKLFGINDASRVYIQDYLGMYLIGYVIVALNNLLLFLPRYFQNITIIYKALGITFVVNFIASPLLMLLFSILHYPVISGAALGTILANLVCSLYLIWKLFFKDFLGIGLSRKDLAIKFQYTLLIENKNYIGSQVLTGITFNLSSFLYILILSYYPSNIFNVYALGSYAFTFFGIIANNFSASLIPMVSQNAGAKKFDETKELVRRMLMILAVYGFSIAIFIMISRNFIGHILSKEENLQVLFSSYFLFYSIPWAFNILATVFIFVTAGSGDSKGSMILTIVNMYVLVITGLLTIPHFFNNMSTGVFFALGMIQILTFLFSMFYYLTGRWAKASLIKAKEQEEALVGT